MKILIVGAGLYGAVCAHELANAGHDCTVLEQREHIGGNVYTRYDARAHCHEHVYGAHIFHTNSQQIWDWVGQFSSFTPFVNRVKARVGERLYSLPVNLCTLHEVFGVCTPDEARLAIAREQVPHSHPANMEEYCLATIGPTLYRLLIEGYSAKQWGRHPRELPPDAVKRLPVRFSFDDNYFNDRYQGVPSAGYTAMVAQMLEGARVELGVDFLEQRDKWMAHSELLIYTGAIDAFFGYRFGPLEYRSLRFEREWLASPDFQGNAVVNYPELEVPWTRIIEHRHFDPRASGLPPTHTLITREYPDTWQIGKPSYYPVHTPATRERFAQYTALAEPLRPHVHFGGRLAEYRYYDMHQVIGAALKFCSTVDMQHGNGQVSSLCAS